MKNFFRFFLENSKLTFAVTFAIIVLGVMGFKNLRRESRPAVDFAQAIITTVFPGASSKEVEELVTFKIEEQIRVVDGIEHSRSTSSPGRSYIHLRIDIDNTDSTEVVDELQRSLSRVKGLPDNILDPPFLLHFKAKEIPLLEVILSGDNTYRKRDQLAFQLKTLLERDSGVAGVRMTGYQPREFKILLNSQKMNTHHTSIEEVIQAVRSHTQDFSAGFIRSSSYVKQVRFISKITQAHQLEDIVIRSNFSGQKILLKDIAQVSDDKEEPKELIRFNGKPTVQIMVLKKEKEDSIRLSSRIKKILQDFTLPEGYKIQIYNNEADRTQDQLSIVVNNAWVGLFFVLFVLLLLLPGWVGILSSLSLPISILGTIAFCSSFGITFNTITMLAIIICIGMLVDNAVVISENYARLRENNHSPIQSALNSVFQLYKPITATVLTTVFAFLPMLVTKGIMGQFIMWIPIVVSTALMVNLCDAFFLLPSRLKFTLQKAQIKTSKIQKYFNVLTEKFEKCISYCIQRRWLCFSLLTVLIIFSLSVNFLGNQFILFPKSDVRHYHVLFTAQEGTSIEKTDSFTRELIEDIIETVQLKNIDGLISKSGMNAGSSFVGKKTQPGEHIGEMILLLKKDSPLRSKSESLLKKLRTIDKKSFQNVQFEALAGGPPVGNPIHLVFTSNDRSELVQMGNAFKKELSQINGIIDIEDDQISTGEEFQIFPNSSRLAELKIPPLTVATALQTALQGSITGEMVDNGESFYVRVYYDQYSRSNIQQLKKIKIVSPSGSLISLDEVITVKTHPKGSPLMKRFNFLPSLEVTAQVKTDIITSEQAHKKISNILDQLISQFATVSYTYAGERKHTQESMQSLFQAMILAVFGIFAILLVLFRSFMVSFLALSSISLGLIGVSIAFALHDRPLSFLAMIGVVGLAGVTINSAIILISLIEDMKKQQPQTPLSQILTQSSKYRFKPIIITTFTTVLGLFPSAYGIGGDDSLLIPMTLAFTWGLTTGSLLTLFWIPCGYAMIDDISQWTSKIWSKITHSSKN